MEMSQDNLYRSIRSTSLPTRSHPLAVRFEEELQKLKALSTTTKMPTPEILCHQLGCLGTLYGCLEKLLRMPSAQQALAQKRHQKWVVEEEMDLSLALLDIAGSLKDALCLTSCQLKDCQSALRTGKVGAPAAFEEKLLSYICCRKKTMKDFDKCLVTLKQVGRRCLAMSSVRNEDQQAHDLSVVATALGEVRLVTVEVFQSIYLCIAGSSRSRGWRSLFPKAKVVMLKGRDCAVEHCSNEIQEVDESILSLYRSVSTTKVFINTELTQKKVLIQLMALESGVDQLESGLDALFQRIMHHRVSLLNMVTW